MWFNTYSWWSGKTVVVCGATVTIAISIRSKSNRFWSNRNCRLVYTQQRLHLLLQLMAMGFLLIHNGGGTVTVTLPSSPSAGDIIAIKDYAKLLILIKLLFVETVQKLMVFV